MFEADQIINIIYFFLILYDRASYITTIPNFIAELTKQSPDAAYVMTLARGRSRDQLDR